MPAQSRMVQRLAKNGLLRLTEDRRFNHRKCITEKRAVRSEQPLPDTHPCVTNYQRKHLERALNEKLMIGGYLGMPLNAARPLARQGFLESDQVGETAVVTDDGKALFDTPIRE